MAAPRSLQGLKLLVPESVAALVENPTSMARARIESTLIVVAGPGDHEMGGEDADALRHLAEGVVSWPVVVGPPSIQADGESGWFRMLGSRPFRPLVLSRKRVRRSYQRSCGTLLQACVWPSRCVSKRRTSKFRPRCLKSVSSNRFCNTTRAQKRSSGGCRRSMTSARV